MKKFILTFIMTFCLSSIGFCQNILDRQSNFIKFLGIPVDGSKYEMMSKLKQKGFTYDDSQDNWIRMNGYFDGYKSSIYIIEYYGKVGRICVFDKNTVSEAEIKIRFNSLVNKFDNNPKYERTIDNVDYYISDNEDISYNMSIKDKFYTADYSLNRKTPNDFKFINELPDSTINNAIYNLVNSIDDIKSVYKEFIETTDTTSQEYINAGWKSINHAFVTYMMFSMSFNDNLKQSVWFRIFDYDNGEYGIGIYYDNKINHPDGSEL